MHKSLAMGWVGLALLAIQILSVGCNSSDLSADPYYHSIAQHRLSLDTFFRSSKKSPFYSKKNFTKLQFYDIDPSYLLRVPLQQLSNPQIVQFKTNTAKMPVYLKQYKLQFELQNSSHSLMGYVSSRNPQILFIPFKDLTNAQQTYGGGRYLELPIPDSDTLNLDFNLAFNPYCHYDTGFACPLVPRENYLNIAVQAGEKIYQP